MRKTAKNQTKRLLISAVIIAAVYAVIIYFNISKYMIYGTWMTIGWIFGSSDTVRSFGSNLFLYTSQFFVVFAPVLIIGFILAIYKFMAPFRTAFIYTMFAYLLSSIFSALSSDAWTNSFIIPLVAMFVAYILARTLLKRINKPILIWVTIVSLVVINILIIPMITSAISRPISEDRQLDELHSATKSMQFTPYYPSYIPEGLKATTPKLEGYHNTTYQHKHVNYNVGKLEIMISEKLKNQDSVFNRTDNCDISAIWFSMDSRGEVRQSEVEKSRDNLAICRILGKTNTGHEVYIKANKSQFEFYYMEIGGTIIVMQQDKLPKPRYPEGFENEVLKIFNSMKKLEISRIEAGY